MTRITDMVGMRKLVAGTVAAALMISASTPAFAGWQSSGDTKVPETQY